MSISICSVEKSFYPEPFKIDVIWIFYLFYVLPVGRVACEKFGAGEMGCTWSVDLYFLYAFNWSMIFDPLKRNSVFQKGTEGSILKWMVERHIGPRNQDT